MNGRIRRIALVSVGLMVIASGCANRSPSVTDHNKALVRQMIQELDAAPTADVVAKWMTADYKLFTNGAPAMDLAGYQNMVQEIKGAFSNVKHEIHHIVAEGDTVAVALTLKLTHTGTYEGIAPTGRTVAIEEFVMIQMRDGKAATEWAVVDLGGLRQQLTAAAKE